MFERNDMVGVGQTPPSSHRRLVRNTPEQPATKGDIANVVQQLTAIRKVLEDIRAAIEFGNSLR
ncbi:hypothetical protein MMOR_27890 [Mycolicibacterium moriokaense]|uniref:Uncharacterized protein n=1 Tax=Mycolicibacterium moriokaense TaxID=39691 RepID=A0AAD1HD66_9MYCO|nr:hypothetical protein MMOR_27890 [Mycolicibacterium moriokaense]